MLIACGFVSSAFYTTTMPTFLAQAQNAHALTEVVLGLIGSGIFSFAIGWFLVRQAWGNFQAGRVPLVGSVELTGGLARWGAFLLLGAGVAAMTSGAGLVLFIFWRLISVLAAG